MCTSQPSAMPALGIERGGSLPSTYEERGSTPALRWPWLNRKDARDLKDRGRVRPNGNFVSGDPWYQIHMARSAPGRPE